MISQWSRYVYLGELHLYTRMNYFPNDVPTAKALFSEMKIKEAVNKSHFIHGSRTVSIEDIEVSDNFVEILFHVEDPNIPDHVVRNKTTKSHRALKRDADEDPVVAAHLVVKISKSHDTSKRYPTAIENNEYLPRSYMVLHLNEVCARHFSKLRPWVSKKKVQENKIWLPRFDFGASKKATIKTAIMQGGKLKGVKWVEQVIKSGTPGDGAHPQTERKQVQLEVANGPTGMVAQAIIGDWQQKLQQSPTRKNTSIIIEDNDKQKVVPIPSNSTDVLGTAFIPQVEVVMPKKSPLGIFEEKIRADFTSLMKGQL